MIGGEGADLARRAVNADLRAHFEGVTLDAALELLIAVVGEAHRPAREEHPRQCKVEHERRVVAPAEAAAHVGEVRVDAGRLEGSTGFAEHEGDGLGRVVRRLHAEHELELAAVAAEPGEAGFGLQEHRVDRLRLELAIEHQERGVLGGELSPDLLAVDGALGVVGRRLPGERRPHRKRRILDARGTDPACLDRRIDVGCVGRRARHAREAEGTVVGTHDGAGLLAEPHEGPVAQCQPRLIERVEMLEDQQRHRLAEIERRLADGAEEVAGVERGHAGADPRKIVGRHHHSGLERAFQASEVHARVDVRRSGARTRIACEVVAGQPGMSAARKSEA